MEGAVVDGDRLLPAAGRDAQSRGKSRWAQRFSTGTDYCTLSTNTVCSADRTVPQLISITKGGKAVLVVVHKGTRLPGGVTLRLQQHYCASGGETKHGLLLGDWVELKESGRLVLGRETVDRGGNYTQE